MASFRSILTIASCALLLGALGFSLVAQTPDESSGAGKSTKGEKGEGRKGEGRRGGGPGNFDPQQMHQLMMERYKETLGMSDEEWKLASPKIEKVMAAQREARFGGGFMGSFGPGWGRGGPDGGRPGREQDPAGMSPLAKATSDLRTTLDDKAAGPDDIGKKLAAVRSARDAARETLVKNQNDLKALLTPRQEASLVLMSVLD
jgi:Spy/CpxP family protein refolding chaperone